MRGRGCYLTGRGRTTGPGPLAASRSPVRAESSPMLSRSGMLCGSAGGCRPADALAGEDPEGFDAVFPGDLLAFFAGAGAVADRHLIGPVAVAQQLAGDLGLHAEAGG